MRARDLNLRVTRDVFAYYRCGQCGLVFIERPPVDLSRYYPRGYYKLPADHERLRKLARREQFKVDLIRPHQASGDLLEVGSAWGSFAFAAKSAGYRVTAIDIDDACIEYLRSEVGVRAYRVDSAGALPDMLGTFDVIALWHVLEHLNNFEQVLTELAAMTRDGGLIVIASPNPESWQLRLMRERWPHLDAPRHLQLVPPNVIMEILSAVQFELVDWTETDPGGLRWNRFSWQRFITNELPRGRAATAVGLVGGAALGTAMMPLDRRRGSGATYTILLRKTRNHARDGGNHDMAPAVESRSA